MRRCLILICGVLTFIGPAIGDKPSYTTYISGNLLIERPLVTRGPEIVNGELLHQRADPVKITAQNPNNDNNNNASLSQPSSSITSMSSAQTTSSLPPLPTLSTSSDSTDLPVPTVTVPSSADNPFILQSNLPEGTVFIAVGAILGGFAVAIIAWRILAARALRNSLKRDEQQAAALLAQDLKAPLYPPEGPKNYSADNVSSNKITPMANMPGQSLFFSPTTEVMNSASTANMVGGTGSITSTLGAPGGTRSSVYLPSGYYGSGSAGTGPGSFTSRSSRHLSMARESMYGAPMTQTGGTPGRQSVYTRQETQRAPSAYLDDLLAHED
jgi:hypothetical protein